jgi:hypothetical protein
MLRAHDSTAVDEIELDRSADSLPAWACLLFLSAVLVVCFARLLFGVDFVDESTYVAVPYRFCLGDAPFVDEHTPIQTSALLSLPFAALFHAVRGGSEGLVLYLRIMYFFLCCGVATAVATGIKPLIGARGAWIVASACVAFCPVGIPNLSYNTWSIAGFTIGVFVGLQHLLWRRRIGWMFAAGTAHGLAAVALPSYVLPNLVYAAGATWLLARGDRLRGVVLYALGGIAACALFLPWIYRFDRETLDNAYFHVHTAEGWAVRVRQFAYQLWIFVPVKLELGAGLAAVFIGVRRRIRWLVPLALALLPLFPLCLKRTTHSLWYVAMIALCGTVFLAMTWREPLSKRLLGAVWFPSLCAGAVASLTSLNGLVNSGCGLFPIALCGMTLAVVLAREAASGSAFERTLEFAFPMLVVAALVAYQRQPFGEDRIAMLNTRVSSGPFLGLQTTPEKATFLRAITADLTEAAKERREVLFIEHFPAGYLLTSLRPATACIWTYPCTGGPWDDCFSQMRRNIAQHEGPDLLIVRMHAFPTRHNNMWESFRNELDDLLEDRFRPIVDRSGYTMFVAK